MKIALSEKKKQIKQKMTFLSNIPAFYYIISQEKQTEYSALLERIKSRSFGSAKKSAIENVARYCFKSWTIDRDWQGICKDATGFVSFVDECVSQKSEDFFYAIEENADSFALYAQESVAKMKNRCEQLAEKSFRVQNSLSFLAEKRILLNPVCTRLDSLGECINDALEVDRLETPNEFTLGSVVFFKDYLYMNLDSLQKIDVLKKYDSVCIENANFEQTQKSEGVGDDELSVAEKCVRSVLLDYWKNENLLFEYKNKFGKNLQSLDDGQVNALSKVVSLSDSLLPLSDAQLSDFAKDANIPLSPNRQRQIRLIVSGIEKN